MIERVTRHERALAVAIAVLLVIVRSLPFALYEQIQFDSDQAVFGLMAKHLSEGRAFPLFMYGSAYLLAVEAWLAAPWFLVAPINLTTLSLPLVLTNMVTAVLLVLGLERWGGLRPMHALVASLFFVLAPPIVAGDLVSVSGGNVEPFVYIALLWIVVDRPFLFGAVLAIGILQREFTIYAVPVLVAADAIRNWPALHGMLRKWLIALVVFLAVWQAVQALQPYSDLMGPGTRGQLLGGFAGSQVANLAGRVTVDAGSIPARIEAMARLHVPRMLGGIVYEEGAGRRRPWLTWLLAAGIIAALLRTAFVVYRTARSDGFRRLERAAFGWYLLAVGVLAGAAYLAARPVTEEYSRYGLLVILVPIGLVAVLLSLDSQRRVRAVAIAAVIAWASVSLADTARLYLRYAKADPDELRVLADALVARNVRTADAPYWTAYAVTFLTGERVKVASTDFVRITEYQAAAAADPDAIHVREQPCARGERVARWYLCRR
jgi:hypothetical protein